MKNHPVIVAIAYNRDKSLLRLLNSLNGAYYPEDEKVTLIISIDKSDNGEVANVADSFEWKAGEKIVVKREENMGLKKHVLTCGNYSLEYGSAILLEDDLYVAKDFYRYACQALDFTENNDKIAGVSLYNHRLNVHAREPFETVVEDADGWYFQFASSWGQAFTAKQWQGYCDWMAENDGKNIAKVTVPANVSSWSERSWLKYYICYMIENDLYFLYPQVSLTTNFSEEGTHSMGQVADLQVPLLNGTKPCWKFRELEDSAAVYDAFFENVRLKDILCESLGCKRDSLCLDLYGYRTIPKGTKYLLSCKALSYARVASYGMYLRPLEENVFQNIPGNSFFLYDLTKRSDPPITDPLEKIQYHYRAFRAGYGLSVIHRRLKKKFFSGRKNK